MDEGTGWAEPQIWPLRGHFITGSALRLTDWDRIDWEDPGGLCVFMCYVVISLLEPLMSFCWVPNRVVVPSERQIKLIKKLKTFSCSLLTSGPCGTSLWSGDKRAPWTCPRRWTFVSAKGDPETREKRCSDDGFLKCLFNHLVFSSTHNDNAYQAIT
jgi:hypothetical protein